MIQSVWLEMNGRGHTDEQCRLKTQVSPTLCCSGKCIVARGTGRKDLSLIPVDLLDTGLF